MSAESVSSDRLDHLWETFTSRMVRVYFFIYFLSPTGSMFKGLNANDGAASFVGGKNVLLVRISRRNRNDKLISFASICIRGNEFTISRI